MGQQSSQNDWQKLQCDFKRFRKKPKIPTDYKHNQSGLHEITIRDNSGNDKKTIPGQDFSSFEKGSTL